MKFDLYDVTLRLIEPMLGTVPKDPEVYANYIAKKAPSEDLATAEISAEEQREDLEKAGWTGFHSDEKGLFLYDYQVMGFIKEAGNVLKCEAQIGIKNLRSKLENFVYVEPRRIYFAAKPAGYVERPLRGMTAQGPRVTLVRSDYVPAGTEIKFRVRILAGSEISANTVELVLEYGQLRGLGQFRTGGYGRFEVVRFEKAA